MTYTRCGSELSGGLCRPFIERGLLPPGGTVRAKVTTSRQSGSKQPGRRQTLRDRRAGEGLSSCWSPGALISGAKQGGRLLRSWRGGSWSRPVRCRLSQVSSGRESSVTGDDHHKAQAPHVGLISCGAAGGWASGQDSPYQPWGSDPHGLNVTPQEHLGGDVGPGWSLRRILCLCIPQRTQGREGYSPVTAEGENEAGAGP